MRQTQPQERAPHTASRIMAMMPAVPRVWLVAGGGWIVLLGTAVIACWRGMMRGRPLVVALTAPPLRPVVRPSARRPASPPATGFGRRRR